MQRRTLLRLGLAAGATLALTGCGFRLRGLDGAEIALEEMALAGPDSELARLVAEHLERSGTRVHADAPRVLNLGPPRLYERNLGVMDAGNQELELTLDAPFSVQRREDGAYLLDQQRLEVSERISVSDDDLLAQDDLREAVTERLRREAVRQLMDRLRALDAT
ncbi:LPS assembly lipoprotein LptE [Halomonas cerina]|uniref:LPS-assembly lipoprotein LptE n=1 Tax=Halomonas cerina TaxID=447424 RepID=A0A839V7X1_9GAMM|nr:LPS assembly lipoprotein LptE [Halomonas cerina]MBB3188817.1 LPS-assembly lipoprotein [Halomonas cerina]